MKRKINAILSVALILILLVGMTSAGYAAEANDTSSLKTDSKAGSVESKEEVVYSMLLADGTVDDIYVVNILNVTEAGLVEDIGTYDSVKNLTNTETLTDNNGTIQAEVDVGRYYYQGNFGARDLPWDVSIEYSLNGKKIDPAQLGGETGSLEIHIRTKQNKKLDASFYENYMLQVSLSLDSETCKNITADGATFANAGSQKMITFTVMPDTEGDMVVNADVTDFEMEGVSLTGIPFSMDIDIGDISEMTDGLSTLAEAIELLHDGVSKLESGGGELKDGVREINDAIHQMNEGIGELHDGTKELDEGVGELKDGAKDMMEGVSEMYKGSGEFFDGLDKLNESSTDLLHGSYSIYEALQYIEKSLSGETGDLDLSSLTQLPAGLNQIADELDGISLGMSQMQSGFSLSVTGMNAAFGSFDGSISDTDVTTALGALLGTPEYDTIYSLYMNYKIAQSIKSSWLTDIYPAFQLIDTNLVQLSSGINIISGTLRAMASQIEQAVTGMDIMDSLQQLSEGLSTLTGSYKEFHDGLKEYTGGVNEIYKGYVELHSGIGELSSGTVDLYNGVGDLAKGTAELADGVGELYSGTEELSDGMEEFADGISEFAGGIGELADGTAELNEETKDMPEMIETEVDDLLSSYDTSDFEPVSFVTGSKGNVSSVQFVIQAEAITKPEAVEEIISQEEQETFWTRFKALFQK